MKDQRADMAARALDEEVLLQCLEDSLSGTPRWPISLEEVSSEMLELLTFALPDTKKAFYTYDPATDRVRLGAERIATLFGQPVGTVQLMQEGWWPLVHVEDAPAVQQSALELASGVTPRSSMQMRLIRKDGRWEWIHHTWQALQRDADGLMTLAVGMVQVITPMAEATQALRNEAALDALSRKLVEEWTQSLFLLDREGAVLHANQGAIRSLGYELDELRGLTFRHFTEGAPLQKQERGLPMPSHEAEWVFKGTHIRKNGTQYPAEVSLRRISGNRALVLTRDITHQEEQAEATRRQMAYYRGLFENNASGVAVFDQDLYLTEINPALRRMLGYTDKQMLRMRLPDLLAAESEDARRTWDLAASSGQKPSVGQEVALRRRDGKTIHVHAAVTFMSPDAQGESHGTVILTDVMARRKAEAELAKESEFNRTLVRESAAMISMLDKQGRILKVNPAVERRTGFAARELEGRILWESGLVFPGESAIHQEMVRRIIHGLPQLSEVASMKTKSGERRLIELQGTAAPTADGEIERIIVTAIDVTDREDLHRQLMQAVEQEQARIGHDLHDGAGQLLTGIGTLTEALVNDLEEGQLRKDAQYIHELTRQAIQQIRQLSHGMSPTAVQHRGLDGSLKLLASTVRETFRRNCECSIDSEVTIEDLDVATHVFRIAQEAVNNAVRHGSPENVFIALRAEGNNRAVLEVSNDGRNLNLDEVRPDSGIGIRVMNYRATLIRGDLQIRPRPLGGVQVICHFPSGRFEGSTTRNKTKPPNQDTQQ